MPTLSQYANVYPTALRILKEKGYQIWFDPETNLFWAERDGWDFTAEDACALLGVVAIYEHREPSAYEEYWWRKEEIDTRSLPHQPAPYRTVLAAQGRGSRKTRGE